MTIKFFLSHPGLNGQKGFESVRLPMSETKNFIVILTDRLINGKNVIRTKILKSASK